MFIVLSSFHLKMIELSLSKKVWGFDKLPTFIHSFHSLHTFLLLTVCPAFLQELEDAQQYRTLGLKHNSNIDHSQEVLRNNVWIYVSAHSYTVSIYVVPYYRWENWPPPPNSGTCSGASWLFNCGRKGWGAHVHLHFSCVSSKTQVPINIMLSILQGPH